MIGVAQPAAHGRLLEPLERGHAGLDDRVVQALDVGERLGVGLRVALAERAVHTAPAGRRVVGVVPVQEDARARCSGRLRDALPDHVHLRRLDRKRVDATEDDPRRVALERGRGHLERAEALACGPVAAHDADERQPERRVDVRAG